MAYQAFETQAINQAIHNLALWLTPHVGKWPKAVEREELPGGKAIESLRSWFQHLSHADSYRLRVALWREAKPILGGFVC